MQFAAQHAGERQDSGTKQQDAAGFRSGTAALRGVHGESFRRDGTNHTFGGRRRALWAIAAGAAVLIPEDRIAAGDDRVRQVEPELDSLRHLDAGDQGIGTVDVVAELVAGNKVVDEVLTGDRTVAQAKFARTRSILGVGNGVVYRHQRVAREFPDAEVETGDYVVVVGEKCVADDVAKV